MHLGYSEQERYQTQCVSFTIAINFAQNPKATLSDDLNDSFCYAEAISLVREHIKNKHYKLIEYLATEVHNILNSSLIQKKFKNTNLSVTVLKLSPPVPDIHGGVSFTYYG